MINVSRSDQIMRLVRHQLEKASRQSATAKQQKSGRKPNEPFVSPLESMRGMGDLDERQFNRLAVQSILTMEFGSEVVDSAAFTAIADRVHGAIQSDPALLAMFAELRRSMRERSAEI